MPGEFESLLRRTMGLDAASIGSSSIGRAVKARMSASSMDDAGAYLELVQSSGAELQELIEAVVVPETWFFRDREAFAAMVRQAREEQPTRPAASVLRLLSLPCSTGEEPHSMAMALLDAGFPSGRFRIDAVDISARALALARRGIYGKNSFRGSDLGFRDRYFVEHADGWHLDVTVRNRVQFIQANLFDARLLPSAAIYDIIFCRNMLIYFDGDAQNRAIGVLIRLMAPNGLLFVGPSEANLLLDHGFVSAKIPLAFAFRKATAASPEAKRDRPARQPAPPIPAAEHRPTAAPAARPANVPQPHRAVAAKPDIDEIRRMADRGELGKAAQHCLEYLRAGGGSPEALYLLGLICDASGNRVEAASSYRKTLYLDPNHREALLHLALLLEKQGDRPGAKVLNDRLRRLDRDASG